ncbi:hypothetical protein [Leucobacter salsicius]|uniref:hypothetical protein n=1 Tax=Leucobacter salsicius TaxID=664638 RepID=UPI00034B9D38|nr:hypothetical protein [Leucobacter salsicius]
MRKGAYWRLYNAQFDAPMSEALPQALLAAPALPSAPVDPAAGPDPARSEGEG